MIPIDKVKKIIERYISLEKELSTGKVEPKLLAKKSKEYSDLKNIVSIASSSVSIDSLTFSVKNNTATAFSTLPHAYRDGDSVHRQKSSIIKWVKSNGYSVKGEYWDIESGKMDTMDRPEFMKM